MNHLLFHLNLVNRWARGEDPFADANWAESWQVQSVTEDEWRNLRSVLREQATAWIGAVTTLRPWDWISLTGVMAGAAHVAYHFGAVRQQLAVMRDRGN